MIIIIYASGLECFFNHYCCSSYFINAATNVNKFSLLMTQLFIFL